MSVLFSPLANPLLSLQYFHLLTPKGGVGPTRDVRYGTRVAAQYKAME